MYTVQRYHNNALICQPVGMRHHSGGLHPIGRSTELWNVPFGKTGFDREHATARGCSSPLSPQINTKVSPVRMKMELDTLITLLV